MENIKSIANKAFEIAKELDRKDGKEDNKISAKVWKNYAVPNFNATDNVKVCIGNKQNTRDIQFKKVWDDDDPTGRVAVTISLKNGLMIYKLGILMHRKKKITEKIQR